MARQLLRYHIRPIRCTLSFQAKFKNPYETQSKENTSFHFKIMTFCLTFTVALCVTTISNLLEYVSSFP